MASAASNTVRGVSFGHYAIPARASSRAKFRVDFGMLWKRPCRRFHYRRVPCGFRAGPFAWRALFLKHPPDWMQVPANAVIGVVIAVLSFVCSIGNVPMAAILWGSGISFGGVLAFSMPIFRVAATRCLPALLRLENGGLYRRDLFRHNGDCSAYSWICSLTRSALCRRRIHLLRAEMTHFALNYTFWLNLVLGALGC